MQNVRSIRQRWKWVTKIDPRPTSISAVRSSQLRYDSTAAKLCFECSWISALLLPCSFACTLRIHELESDLINDLISALTFSSFEYQCCHLFIYSYTCHTRISISLISEHVTTIGKSEAEKSITVNSVGEELPKCKSEIKSEVICTLLHWEN